MAVTSDVIEGMLKEVYGANEVYRLANKEAALMSRVKKSPVSIGGEGHKFAVNVQGNEEGTGAIGELQALREPGAQVPQKGTILPKINTQNLRFSGLSLAIADSEVEAFVNNQTYQLDEAIADVGREMNSQLFRDGTGRVALVNGAVVASATVTFDNGVGTHFRIGEKVDIINAANTKQVDSIQITDVDPYGNTLTLASAVSCDDNSAIFRDDVSSLFAGSAIEMTGLKVLTDNGTLTSTYEGIDRTVYNQFDGITVDAGGANLSDDLLQDAAARVRVASGGKVDKLVMNPNGQMRKYLAVLTPFKEFRPKEKMDSGVDGPVPTWNGLEIIEDDACGFDEVYMLSFGDVMMFSAYDLKFDDTDGKVLKYEPGKDSFTAYVKAYTNLGTYKPNRHVRVSGLALPTYY